MKPTSSIANPADSNRTARLSSEGGTRFETRLEVRPDDIDMNQHVHGSRYFDYVLAARYDQMRRCYGMPMEEFSELGFAWHARTTHMEFKRPLRLGDAFVVRTWVAEISKACVRVEFEIFTNEPKQPACVGYCRYVLITLEDARPAAIPDWIVAIYSV